MEELIGREDRNKRLKTGNDNRVNAAIEEEESKTTMSTTTGFCQ